MGWAYRSNMFLGTQLLMQYAYHDPKACKWMPLPAIFLPSLTLTCIK
jgi:hypothetical protein